ncbi:MAG: dTMP kinase [Burkholderiales bacterium]|jgi:dTMP kinase|nr:dTMP kinase [Burkholderiales bacterium]
MKRGLFISVEGIDGAGKSTHVEFIREYLQNKGLEVIVTREPGGTVVGEKIRELLLTSEHMHHNTELLLYFASRQEIIRQVIVPNLEAGVCVIADRFVDASIAYQGGGRELGVAKIKLVYGLLEPTLTTDMTFLFDVPLSLAMDRLSRGRELDRIELESREFFARVQNTYHQLAADEPQRIKKIMTNHPIAHTREQLVRHLELLLAKER